MLSPLSSLASTILFNDLFIIMCCRWWPGLWDSYAISGCASIVPSHPRHHQTMPFGVITAGLPVGESVWPTIILSLCITSPDLGNSASYSSRCSSCSVHEVPCVLPLHIQNWIVYVLLYIPRTRSLAFLVSVAMHHLFERV